MIKKRTTEVKGYRFVSVTEVKVSKVSHCEKEVKDVYFNTK